MKNLSFKYYKINLIEDEDFFVTYSKKKRIKDTEEIYIRIKNLINIENDENNSEDDDEKMILGQKFIRN